MITLLTRVSFTILLTLYLVACGSTPDSVPGTPKDESTAIQEYVVPDKGCAVGGAKIRSTVSSAQDFATNTARANLSASLKETVQQMVKQYTSEGQVEDKETAEQLNTRVIRSLSENEILGGILVRSYRMGDEMQSIVCIEPAVFFGAFDKMKQLSDRAKQALKLAAQAEFKDMDEQLANLRARSSGQGAVQTEKADQSKATNTSNKDDSSTPKSDTQSKDQPPKNQQSKDQ